MGAVRDGAELERWYWLRTELAQLARSRGLATSGSKAELTRRLAASLDGRALPAVPRRRPATREQLTGELTPETLIPHGQRSSQVLRAFFEREIGPSFRFDGPMREFVREGGGRPLGEAVAHWYATRDRPRSEIGPQFELNRFVRAWFDHHPGGTHADAVAAWRVHRSRPIERRT